MSASAIGARIKKRREELGLSQAALAAKIGKTRSAIAQWERKAEGCAPSAETLPILARALDLTIDRLLGVRAS